MHKQKSTLQEEHNMQIAEAKLLTSSQLGSVADLQLMQYPHDTPTFTTTSF